MPRPRELNAHEVATWLAVMLDAAFDPATQAVTPEGQAQLLALASDFTHYPNDFPNQRRAQLLLRWAGIWLPDEWWQRLHGRVRKRRSRQHAKN